jgi:hypothetical protein
MKPLRSLLPWILTALAPVMLFFQTLASGEVLFWGTPMLQFVPWRRVGWDMLRAGTAPLWNPYVGMGAPLLANYQTAFLYPPNWILPFIGIEWGHGLLMMFHLIFAGWGMILLMRRLGYGLVAQLISGIAFSLSGYLVSRAWFISIDSAAAWLPWVIWGVEGLSRAIFQGSGRARVIRHALSLSALLGLQWLAGHAQMSWYTLLFAAAWMIWRGHQAGGWRAIGRALLVLSASLGTAFLLSAAQLLPTAQFMLQSQRASGLGTGFALTYSFWPWRLAGLLMPDLFGNPGQGNFWGYGNYWEDAVYIGVIPLMLLTITAWNSLRKKGDDYSLGRFLLLTAAVSLLFALGENTPVYPFLFEHIPTFSLFQAPARWNLLFVFSIALMAGMGVQGWRSPGGRGLYWSRLGTAGVGAIGFAAYLGTRLIPDLEVTFARAFAVAGLWLFVFGMLTLFGRKDDSQGWIMLVGAILVVDLVTAGRGLNPSTPVEVYQGKSGLAANADPDHRVYMPSELEERMKFEVFFRFDTFDPGVEWGDVRQAGLPNVTSLDLVPSANNFDPLLTARYRAWVDALEALPLPGQLPYLRLMNVSRIAGPDPGMPAGVRYQAI